MKRLIAGSGYEIRETSDTVSLDITKAEERHQFKTTAHYDGAKWWLSVDPGYVRYSISVSSGIVSDSSGNVSYAGGLQISADDLANTAHLQDASITNANCYKSKRFASGNLLATNQYEADGPTLVFAYASNPGAQRPKLGITSVTVFNNYFASGAMSGYSVTPIIGIRPTGGTYWRRIGLNVMPIAYFENGVVTQYCRDTLDMVVESETAWSVDVPQEDETTAEYAARVGINHNWGAYFYETGADGAPSGYTFEGFAT